VLHAHHEDGPSGAQHHEPGEDEGQDPYREVSAGDDRRLELGDLATTGATSSFASRFSSVPGYGTASAI